MTRAPMAITDMDALNAALAWRWLLKLESSIDLRLGALSEHERERLQSEINKYASACGCGDGAITTALSIMLYLLSLLFGVWRPATSTPGLILIGFGTGMAGGATGKFIGLLRARKALRRVLLEARDLTAPRISPAQKCD